MTDIGIYIDDDPKAQVFVSRLQSEKLKIVLRQPGELVSMADAIVDERPSVVLLDYRLDQDAGTRGEAVTYRAAPVAQHMRDRTGAHPDRDFPIVLISSEDKIRALYRPEKTAHDLFDWKLIKSNVARSRDASQILVALADGYAQLRSTTSTYYCAEIFGLPPTAMYLVEHQELRQALSEARSPHIAARFLLNVIFRRQGLLLNEANLVARLGVAVPSEIRSSVLSLVDDARYSGVFSGCGERWWAAMVEEILAAVFGALPGALSAAERARLISERLQREVRPAVDRWVGGSDFVPVFACASCQRPTPLKHSLSCMDVGQPSFIQRRRICYTCIQTDAYLERNRDVTFDDEAELRLDASEERVAGRIRAGHVSRASQ